MNRIELLIPAKDLHSGQVAIQHGADALYVGASRFGARQAAGNSLQDLEQLIRYAHLYGSKVHVTVNTLLYDQELEDARKLIWQLYEMGTDALIIQDLGILKMDLPPIALHASTQCHNHSLERVQMLEKMGFKRAILAREVDLDTIQNIRKNTSIELETFVHGALCVCYSGQCYISRMMTGRSGNRGACAQICRTLFDLQDAKGKTLLKDKHLLSLRDMNRSAYLADLMDAGVVSFKVEGRLKDENYVKNITAYYRRIIDQILSGKPDFVKSGSGQTTIFFEPDPKKTFNRGYTSYFVDGQREKMASFDTPKAMGRKIGTLRQDDRGQLLYEGGEAIVNGDGLCFVNKTGELEGFFVNGVSGKRIIPHKPVSVFKQVDLYRNVDKDFEKKLEGKSAERRIAVDMVFSEIENGFSLLLKDEDGVEVSVPAKIEKTKANKSEMADGQLRASLSKMGNTPYQLRRLDVQVSGFFLPTSFINKLRTEAAEQLSAARVEHFQPQDSLLVYKPAQVLEAADYKRNITNELHRAVYEDFGAKQIEYGIDKTQDYRGKELMVCKYCLRYELGMCTKNKQKPNVTFPLYLRNEKYRFQLQFDCKNCEMKIINL